MIRGQRMRLTVLQPIAHKWPPGIIFCLETVEHRWGNGLMRIRLFSLLRRIPTIDRGSDE